MFKILITIDWFIPAYRAGGPIISTWNLVELLKDFFKFYIITSNKDFGQKKIDVHTNKWIKLEKNIEVYYASSASKALNTLIATKADLLIINGIYSPVFSVAPLLKKTPKIIFPRGMLSKHSLDVKSFKKKIFISLFKSFNLYKNCTFFTNSTEELNQIKTNFKIKNIELVPNFVSKKLIFRLINKSAGQLRLVSFARISPVKNYEFAFNMLKYNFNGEITWDIYGQPENVQYFKHIKNLALQLPKNININFRGTIPPMQIRQTITNYHFLFSTTLGENFGHAIFDAFAASRPVIISNTTPWKNLSELKVGWDLELNLNTFRKAIQAAIDLNQTQYNLLINNAYSLAKDFIDKQNTNILKTKDKILKIINTEK